MDDTLEKIEFAFDTIPEEVKAYVFSPLFSKTVKTLCVSENLSDEETKKFSSALYEYIAQLTSEEELIQTIHSVSKTIESSQRIISWVQKEVTEKSLSLILDSYTRTTVSEEEEDPREEKNTSALESIGERLTNTTIIPPSKRDYSIEKKEGVQENKKVDVVDPYRETPQL